MGKEPAKLTRNIQTFSERMKIAQQQRQQSITLDMNLASGVLDEVVKLLASNVELQAFYQENQVIDVELEGGKF